MVTTRGPRYNRRRGSGNIPVAVAVDFNWFGDRVERDVDQALVDAMQRALDSAIRLTQIPGWTPVRTGDLMASITDLGIRVLKTRVIGEFGSPLHYAIFQELGTSRIAGRYYLTRAGTVASKELEKWIAAELKARGY